MRPHSRALHVAMVFGFFGLVLAVAALITGTPAAAYPGRLPGRPAAARRPITQAWPGRVNLEPAEAAGRVWWSGRGNHRTHSVITRTLSLVGAVAPITLSFTTQYDIEPGADFGYVEVLTGAMFVPLPIRSGGELITTDDGNIGNGLTGRSPGWVRAEVDLSEFAGRTTRLLFRYITDDGAMHDGWYLDALELRDANGVRFRDDVEAGPGGWTVEPSDGWRIIEPGRWMLPLGPEGEARPGRPGRTVEHPVVLRNATGKVATVELSAGGGTWPATVRPNRVVFGPNATATITVSVNVPLTATLGGLSRTTLQASLSPTIANQIGIDTFAGSGLYGYVTDYYGYSEQAPYPGEDEVAIFDRKINARVGNLFVGPGTPAFLALSPDGRRLYVSNESGGQVVVIDTQSNVVAGRVQIGEEDAPGLPWPLAVAPDGLVYVLDYAYDMVRVIDPVSLQVVESIADPNIPAGGWWDLALSPDGTRLYVTAIAWTDTGFDPYPLTVFDLVTAERTPVDTGLASPLWVGASPDGREVAVVSPLDNRASIVDAVSLDTRTVTLSAPPGGTGGFRPVFSPDGRRLYVPRGVGALRTLGWPAEQGLSYVSAVDRVSASEVATITVGANPAGMAVSADGRWGYVANASAGTVSRVDLDANRATRTFDVGNTLMELALVGGEYRVYLPVVMRDFHLP